VVVEAALVIPVMVAMFAGIVEYGLLFQHGLDVSNIARQGARAAAAAGRAADADTRIVKAVLGARGSLALTQLDAVVVFKPADASGAMPATCVTALNNGSAGVSDTCSIYRRVTNFAATQIPMPWNPTQRASGLEATRDYIGVYVATSFSSPLGLTLKNRTVSDSAVFRIDPWADQATSTATTSVAATTTTSSSTTTTTTKATTTTSSSTTTTTKATTTTAKATTTTAKATTTTAKATTTTAKATTTTAKK